MMDPDKILEQLKSLLGNYVALSREEGLPVSTFDFILATYHAAMSYGLLGEDSPQTAIDKMTAAAA